ncbi:hypothetical protein NC652_007983 [Populus alba x Populus x berolinensis]|nr:hypothetical protein NC652_007983 [Populus alba x Populus x berolinensis]
MGERVVGSTSSASNVYGVANNNCNPYRNMIIDAMRMNQGGEAASLDAGVGEEEGEIGEGRGGETTCFLFGISITLDNSSHNKVKFDAGKKKKKAVDSWAGGYNNPSSSDDYSSLSVESPKYTDKNLKEACLKKSEREREDGVNADRWAVTVTWWILWTDNSSGGRRRHKDR